MSSSSSRYSARPDVKRVLFVSNGNGEIAIADRIAQEVRELAPELEIDHLALVGRSKARFMHDVGPQEAMPSGGLIAMGNVRNIVRDIGGGLLGLTLAQRRFLVRARGRYARVVAVGDVYALLMALAVRVPATYVGTAKSVRVAPYGTMERRVLRRADQIFVRDSATAERLRSQGVAADAPGNVIVDLFAVADDLSADRAVAGFDPALALFPGSREAAYNDAVFLADVLRRAAGSNQSLGGVLSLAPMLDLARFREAFQQTWTVVPLHDGPLEFELRDGDRTLIRAWRGELGPLLTRVQLVVGQAGTANEAAASGGIPVIAFERGSDRKTAWYRMRQSELLGDALAVFPGDLDSAATGVQTVLADAARRERMAAAGRALMGPPGGARAIAGAIVRSVKR